MYHFNPFMKRQNYILILFVVLFTVGLINPVIGDGPAAPPPPPSHSLNGNQGTGCPIDRQDGIIMVIFLTLAYAGFNLYHRGKMKNEPNNNN
jgi:hypothetical protein